jgi:hypothetical protein
VCAQPNYRLIDSVQEGLSHFLFLRDDFMRGLGNYWEFHFSLTNSVYILWVLSESKSHYYFHCNCRAAQDSIRKSCYKGQNIDLESCRQLVVLQDVIFWKNIYSVYRL